MENFFLQGVVDDLRPRSLGATVGKVWQPHDRILVVDLRLADGRLLLVDADPADPSLFLTRRAVRELEPHGAGERAFASVVRKRLRGARLESLEKPPDDRVVRLDFSAFDASGGRVGYGLVAALTGRSANAYLLGGDAEILATMRPVPADSPHRVGEHFAGDSIAGSRDPHAAGAALGELEALTAPEAARALGFGPTLAAELAARAARMGTAAAASSILAELSIQPPDARLYTLSGPKRRLVLSTIPLDSMEAASCEEFDDPSDAADERARRLAASAAVDAARSSLLARADAALERLERLERALEGDLSATEGAERQRELAESLLAQAATARDVDGGLEIVDLYSPDQAAVVVAADRGASAPQVAARLFASHRRAKRTREEATSRLGDAAARRDRLARARSDVVAASTLAELAALERELDGLLGVRRLGGERGADRSASVPGARRFVSTDGYEILVGRSSKANDALTFRLARSTDLWLHAADYPGSHVVVRNPSRSDVPHRTVLEAAQLAAFYSDAREDAVVEVRYTPRKFVSKPRGGAPGLVRIARFKTVAVRPAADLQRPQ